jgi:flagellar capping protein FliD
MKVDTSGLRDLKVDTSGLQDIKVDTSGLRDIKVDVGDAASVLNSAISSALSQAINVNVSGNSGNAVGGEKFDALAQMISTVKDQLITVRNDLEGKITMIGSNKQTSDIDRQVISIIDSRLANVNQDISRLSNSVGDMTSNMRQKENLYDYKFSDLDYRLSTALNITGVGRWGAI